MNFDNQDNLVTLRELFSNWTLADFLLVIDNPNKLNQTRTNQLVDYAIRVLPQDDDMYYLLVKLYLEKSKAFNRYLDKKVKKMEST